MARALSPLLALYLVTQLALLSHVLEERRAAAHARPPAALPRDTTAARGSLPRAVPPAHR